VTIVVVVVVVVVAAAVRGQCICKLNHRLRPMPNTFPRKYLKIEHTKRKIPCEQRVCKLSDAYVRDDDDDDDVEE
jgi:hypothetical protein